MMVPGEHTGFQYYTLFLKYFVNTLFPLVSCYYVLIFAFRNVPSQHFSFYVPTSRKVKAAGASGTVMRKFGEKVVVQLPSKMELALDPKCMATVGKY